MIRLLCGDARAMLAMLPDASVQCCVTSPPYYNLRDYGVAGQLGSEPTPDAYIAALVAVFREVRRVLRDDGTVWLNLGDSYCSTDKWGGGVGGNTGKHTVADDGAVPSWSVRQRKAPMDGIKPKDLMMLPARVALALQADGWWLRSDIIWMKPNPMPESVTDRPTSAHEHVFLLAKAARYFFDADAVAEIAMNTGGGEGATPDKAARAGITTNGTGASSLRDNGLPTRNIRNVWTIATNPFPGSHFAVMPTELVERCIKAGTKPGDTVLDPFGGAGTVGLVADRLGRDAVLIELNPAYVRMAEERIRGDAPLFANIAAD